MTFTAFDTDLRFTYVAGGLERPGTKLADFLGRHVTEYTQHRPTLHALQRALGGAESTTRDVFNGQSYLTLHGPIRDDRRKIVGVISVSTNVTTDATAETARRQAEELRLYVAQHDPLTGLPGRAALIELLTTLAWSGPGPGALLIIDLDDFQLINEGLGHEVGDAVLLEVGARMARAFPDSMVARKGGDEFAVVFTADIGRDEALAAAARAQATLATPVSVIGHDLQLTAGVGVALKPTHSSSSTLLVDADTALSSAKADGIAQSRLYDYEMRRAAEERLSIQSGLRTALRTGGLRLAYQPIVRLADRLVVGAEALLRWDHAVRGAIPPDVFIPIAEQCGLIHPIGGWVMDRACDDFSALHRDGGLYIAVNVSVRQLTGRSFAGWIDQVLDAKNLSPAGLTIEVTEGALMEDDGSIGRAFAQLRSRGVRIAIDDFGTGYSSLARLQRLPVDIVKLDRAFVTALDSRPEARVMAAAILHLSTAIGAEIIAEGVETEAEAAILLDLGYTTAQGFLFARPMPLAQFRVHSGSPVLGRR
jgi:diguanylate cyclase (GGDEF)-like protein